MQNLMLARQVLSHLSHSTSSKTTYFKKLRNKQGAVAHRISATWEAETRRINV
jgi:hypothetical protein